MGNHMRDPADILLVEDNPGDIRLTREAFQEVQVHGNLHVVRDGDQALAFVHRQGAYADVPRPALILLDLNLPKKNGFEVLAAIKAHESLRLIPVVILTTSSAEEDIARSYELHANSYITKPADWDQFSAMIRSTAEYWLSIVTLPTR